MGRNIYLPHVIIKHKKYQNETKVKNGVMVGLVVSFLYGSQIFSCFHSVSREKKTKVKVGGGGVLPVQLTMGPTARTRCRFLHPGAPIPGMLHTVGICPHKMTEENYKITNLLSHVCSSNILFYFL